ncbi:sensor histidine kinase [Actinocatenispora rupis]|uniref:histidine kinase n=1 Tax=Actinocatenispora rupis TaxID=519421 RepID=A0A8J3NE14_9ACTN|nr:ATP-binding protein [Actinocatenispora rupis]GID15859.1 histidine kinase [Actinocatenispora rupis]
MIGRALGEGGFLGTLLRGGVAVVAVGPPVPTEAADPKPVPAWRRVAMLLGPSAGPVGPDALLHRAGRYLLLAPVAYRMLALPVPVGMLLAVYGVTGLGPVVPVAVALGALNLAMIALVLTRPVLSDGRLRAALLADLVVTVAANVLAAASVPGPLDSPYHDVFWGYLVGTVVLWAGAAGIHASLFPLALSVPTQAAMNWLSDTGSDWVGALGRFGWLALAVVLTALVLALFGMGVRLAMLVGMRAGRQAERARVLRGMHDTVLQTLEAMALSAGLDHAEPAVALAELRGMARSQAGLLRRALGEETDHVQRQFTDDLAEVVAEAVVDGLPTELVVADVDESGLCAARRTALRDAVREALRNTRKHAGRCDALVRVDDADGGIRVVVRDHGRGFVVDEARLGFGLAESVRARLAEVGGTAHIESWPGRGTRITLWTPR